MVPAGKGEHDVGRAEGTVEAELLNYTPTRVEEDSNPQRDSRFPPRRGNLWPLEGEMG
jgi:hypothetical protein